MMLNIDTSNALDELAARLDQSNTLKQLHADKWRRTYGRIDQALQPVSPLSMRRMANSLSG